MVANPSAAIYRFSGYGPTFGNGFDIRIHNNANSNTGSYADFGQHNAYSVPSGVQDQYTILAGTRHFTPDEVEVFYLGWLTYPNIQAFHDLNSFIICYNQADKNELKCFYFLELFD